MHTYILIGRSGCGKGTQGKLIQEFLAKETPSIPTYYLETGQSFRDFFAKGTYSGSLSRVINEEGLLQPEFLAIWAWSHLLLENITGKEHLIIDGTPRRLHEAPVLDSALKFYGRKNPTVIHITVSREWSKARLLKRKRSDDDIESVEKRLNWFETETLPVIYFFKGNPDYRYVEVNGERTIEEIHTDILSLLQGSS